MKSFRKRIGEKGFTLVEALIALAILSIGLVGLQVTIRRSLVSSVKAWDKIQKTNIGMSRLEEHKAQVYNQFLPNMPLPILVPGVRTPGTPGVEFSGNTLIYSSNNRVSMDGPTNFVNPGAGYSVTFFRPSTPSIQPTVLFGPVGTTTPGYAWVDVNGRTACDTTGGNIYFKIDTPTGVNGTMALWFADYGAVKREQRIWMNGLTRGSDYTAGLMSTNPSAPTTLSFPVYSYDTTAGPLTFRVQQLGSVNRTGALLENGTNQTNMTIFCGATYTQTPTPVSTICEIGTCANVLATNGSIVFSGNWGTSGTNPNKYMRDNQNSTTGTARYSFTVGCTGYFKVRADMATNNDASSANYYRINLSNATVVPTPASATVTWYGNPAIDTSNRQWVDVRCCGTNFGNSQTAIWAVNNPGTVSVTFTSGNADQYPRVYAFCLSKIGDIPTNTPTPGGPTPTRTATPWCNFNSTPVIVNQAGIANYVGTPTWGQFGCDNQSGIGSWMGVVGRADSFKRVTLTSGPVVSGGVTGVILEAAGKLIANVRLEGLSPAMSVTMRGIDDLNGPITYGPGGIANPSTTTDEWLPVTISGLSAGITISKLTFDFYNADNVGTNYLAVDSVRIVYDNPLNPNCVLTGASLSVLDTYRDTATFSPYVVDSSVEPNETPTSAGGYTIRVVVHNGRNGVITDTFPAVTITNSISP